MALAGARRVHLRGVAAATVAACVGGCAPDLTFPKSFVFGAATAGFQNEMGCPTIPASQCNDPNSDWYQWMTTPEIAADAMEAITGGPPSTGPGWFELYPQDFSRARNEMHLGAIRLSIEWSRLFPTSTAGVEGYDQLKSIASAPGIAFYHALFAELKKDGLKPLVTINHYTLPLWIHNGVACHDDIASCSPRGWLDQGTITEIAKYAGFVAKEYGGEVDLWATLNEPLAVPLSGYVEPGGIRSNPPGLTLQAADAKTVVQNEIAAHAQMYAAVVENDTVDADGDGKACEVGLVYNMAPAYPANPASALDQQAAQNTFYLYNTWFLNAVILGKYDANAMGEQNAVARPDLGHMDFLGINYYNRINAAGTMDGSSLLPDFSPLLTIDFFNSATQLDVLYPRGIYEMIQLVEQKYNHIPIYITENGTNQGAEDPTAPHDMAQYVQWVQKAVSEGADVRGYFWWTLTDNFEWNHGMTSHFGLYAVDASNVQKPRTIRPLGQTYQRITAAHGVPAALAKEFPIE
jgi:beta-glucosidase/6-phospho-beta-glucosidase/beta-galactosidase